MPVLVVWPLLFGLTLTLLRLFVLVVFGVRDVGPADALALLLGLPGQIAFGLFLALPLHWLRNSRWRVVVYALAFAVVLVNVAAFHFEAAYWRLPGMSLLYYLGEARHLASSASAHAPWVSVLLEVGVTGAILVIAGELLIVGNGGLRARRSTGIATALCLASVVLALAFHLRPSLVPKRYVWSSRVPIFWALQSWGARPATEIASAGAVRRMALDFQRTIGHRVPFGGVDDRYPLCGAGPRYPWKEGNSRSAIFLILESVGNDEVNLVHQGQQVMPHLRRIAAESLAFRNIKAAGTKSSQAMPGLFAGVPPQPYRNLLWHTPLNNLAGFPLVLRNGGYDTAYFHGGDLSFEQQRPFLRMAGFEDIIEFDGNESVQGWGDSDDVVFRKLERWIGAHRAKPYLAALFTLSTHDPHVLPPGRPRVFAGEGHWANYVESLRFLDEELGRFYEWYLKNEAPRGTVLVITGDHVPYLSPDRYTDDDELTRFDVPLIIHSPTSSTARRLDDLATRLGAHYDIPATILGLLDVSPGPCDQGVDLLLPDDQWPSERVVYSVAGDDLENFHVWLGDAHVHVDLATRTSKVTGTAEETGDLKKRAAEVLGMAGALSSYQVEANAFAPPPPTALVRRQALPSVAKPLFVAHRGQSRGGRPPTEQNKWKTIEQAIADGFTWIEVDVQLTRDDHPVLVHDARIEGREVPMLTLSELRALPGMADVLTLEEAVAKIGPNTGMFVEIKTQKNFHRNTLLARKAAAILRGKAAMGRLVMDSFSPIIAASLEQYCRCPVGVDAPFGRAVEQRWIDDQARNGMDWIYVTFKQATPELIRYAHAQGLRVLVYTANDPVEIGHLRTEWPDAFMTDRAEFRSELP